MIIRTKRLILRPFAAHDIEAFSVICADPDVMRYVAGPHDKQVAQARVKAWIKSYKQDGFGLMAVIHKRGDCFIGFCGFLHQAVNDVGYIELAYRFDKAYWNQGLATEAGKAMRNYAFNKLKLKQLISIIHIENQAMKAVAKKIGMQLFMEAKFKGFDVDVFKINKGCSN